MKTAPAERTSDHPMLAIGAILVSVFALSAGDAVIKLTSTGFPIWQIYVLRSLLVVPVLLLALRHAGRAIPTAPLVRRWVLLRSVLLASMCIAYYTALPEVELSLAAAAYYTAPLLITLLAAGPGTTLGAREWTAITALALAMLIGSVGAAIAYQSAPAPVVAVFDYAYLVFAGLWGFLLFAERPDPVTDHAIP